MPIVSTADLAVVPVFVNASAAVLPALLAGLASVLGLLCRPKELIRVWRKKLHPVVSQKSDDAQAARL